MGDGVWNPGFDDDVGEPDTDVDLLDPGIDPPVAEINNLNTFGVNLQHLQGELLQTERENQKKCLVDTFYAEVRKKYKLEPTAQIDYSQFQLREYGKTLYWVSHQKKIQISRARG